MKDWTGNKNSIFKTLGASNHTDKERQNEDFYATDPIASELLLELVDLSNTIVDNSYGEGHLMQPILKSGRKVIGYDIVDRECDKSDIEFHLKDWLSIEEIPQDADIVFNPPYKFALEFIKHSLNLVGDNRKVCSFVKLQFLEGKARKKFFKENPPKYIYVTSSRILCAKNADFEGMKAGGGSAVAYCWVIWEKGYKGETTLRWFN